MFEGTCVFKYTAYVIILKGRSDIALILKTSISTLVVHEQILLFQADWWSQLMNAVIDRMTMNNFNSELFR